MVFRASKISCNKKDVSEKHKTLAKNGRRVGKEHGFWGRVPGNKARNVKQGVEVFKQNKQKQKQNPKKLGPPRKERGKKKAVLELSQEE